MSKPAFAIIVDRATGDQLNAVHELIKSNGDGWWHHFTNLWIVLGKSARDWRDIVAPALKTGGAGVIVFRIAATGDYPKWSLFAPDVKRKSRWLHANLKTEEEE